MKRWLSAIITIVLMFSVLVIPVSAESTASRVDSYITVNSDGDCLVRQTVTLHLEGSTEGLTYPLPLEATNITMNGSSARTTKTLDAIEVDVGRATNGMIGDFSIAFDYTIPEAVKYTLVEKPKENEPKGYLLLTLPLLSGFAYPVESLTFTITMPGEILYHPNFTSIYRQESIESDLSVEVDKTMIIGHSTTTLNDHEGLTMMLAVQEDMFPSVSTYIRQGDPELIPMLIFAGLALLYWLLALRTWPLIRSRSVAPPEGVTAGEMGCHLTLAGGDLTMMVMNWGQLGYLMIQVEGGRVILHKRMDMGNERSQFERRVYGMLFGSRNAVDATGMQYTRLSQKVFSMIPGERNLLKSNSGNTKLFRGLCCISQIFCGICVAMNMTDNVLLQVVLSLILSVIGAVSAWQIHEIAYRTHLRGKTRVYIGMVCILLWIVLGIFCGQWIIPTCAALCQLILGYFAAYGGRRSDVGRHDAGRILGLRRYLKKITREDLDRLQKTDPDYFFNLAPYALSLGVIKPFAKNFGNRKLGQCPYLVTRSTGRKTAEEWAEIIAATADMIDQMYRRMEVEKWTQGKIR